MACKATGCVTTVDIDIGKLQGAGVCPDEVRAAE